MKDKIYDVHTKMIKENIMKIFGVEMAKNSNILNLTRQ